MEFTFLSYWLKAQKRSCRSLFFQQCTKALQKHAEIMESISDIIGPREQNPGAFLLLCRKTKMRHNSVAQATARCRINSFEDFDKVDYEGKRGKQAVSGKEKVLETPLNTIKCEHFCE